MTRATTVRQPAIDFLRRYEGERDVNPGGNHSLVRLSNERNGATFGRKTIPPLAGPAHSKTFVAEPVIRAMEITIEIPDKYGEKLEDLESVDPTIRDQIEVEVLPNVLRLINDAHKQIEQQEQQSSLTDQTDDRRE